MRKAVVWVGVALSSIALCSTHPWDKKPSDWTQADAQRVLEDSPWAQVVNPSFEGANTSGENSAAPLPGPASAGMAGPKSVPDGRWDGGIGRNIRGGLPKLSVTVRWESAQAVLLAMTRTHILGRSSEESGPYTPEQRRRDYIITILGLVPAGRYTRVGDLETRSQSGDTTEGNARDPEQLLEEFMSQSKLIPTGGIPMRAEDAKLDSPIGAIELFFPRSNAIDLATRQVIFRTRFGSMTIQKTFHPKQMVYGGKLDL